MSGATTGREQASVIKSQQELTSIVLEYLVKKGYSRTEASLRLESNAEATRAAPARAEEHGGKRYTIGFNLLNNWVEGALDLYKPEFRRMLWPYFVYSFLSLIRQFYNRDAEEFFKKFSGRFMELHAADVQALSDNKYRLSMSHPAFYTMIEFLEAKSIEGGDVVISILQQYLFLKVVERGSAAGTVPSMMAIALGKVKDSEYTLTEDEGIPGHNPGSANTATNAPEVLPKLRLGGLRQHDEVLEDVRYELDLQDRAVPPPPGTASYSETFETKIKEEEKEDGPTRAEIPFPEPTGADIAMEVQKVKEFRNRIRLEPSDSGAPAPISINTFTFHNTQDEVTCIEFSPDCFYIAIGTSKSYSQIFRTDFNPIECDMTDEPQPSFKLIGHSGPVYGLSFIPSTSNTTINDETSEADTRSQWLLSCSEDRTVKLWCLNTMHCMVTYKGSMSSVWDVRWGPYGSYFASASNDNVARIWNTSTIAATRLLVGHDDDVNCVEWHVNSAYVFTGGEDKTVRMWTITTGQAVRMFTGHADGVNVVVCSPNGKKLASADYSGVIIIWDIASGRRDKELRGHEPGESIHSLTWNAESNMLVSGGDDCTIRVWNTKVSERKAGGIQSEGSASAIGTGTNAGEGSTITAALNKQKKEAEAAAAAKEATAAGSAAKVGGTGSGGGGRQTGKVSPDQIGCFPTKKTPVYKVKFTKTNVVVAAGCFIPDEED